MTVRQEKIEMPFENPIPILVDNSFRMFTYSLYSGGCYAYKDEWRPIVSNEPLIPWLIGTAWAVL